MSEVSPHQAGNTAPRPDPTLLVVDDDELIRNLVRAILLSYGYTVLVAADGPQALALSRAQPGPIELLIADVIMPGMNGLELAGQVTAERPETRVLYISGYSGAILMESVGMPADIEILHKPFTSLDLGARVQAILRAGPEPIKSVPV